MEIISVFPMKKRFGGPLVGLELFKEWVRGYNLQDEIMMSHSKDAENDKVLAVFTENLDRLSLELPEESLHKLLAFHSNHRNRRKIWSVNEIFPDKRIAEEYLNPKANYSQTKFTWKIPNVDRVQNYCMSKIGWNHSEVQSKIIPVIDILSDNSGVQTRLESYFQTYDDGLKFAKVKSKRLLSAFQQSAAPRSTNNT